MTTENRPGVYIIKNKVNSKVYVGSSKLIKRRFKEHKSKLRNNKHKNKHLQRAWNKYGEGNFEFNILLNCRKGRHILFEQEYINLFESFKSENGYNKDNKPIYNSPDYSGVKHTQETKDKLSKILTGKFKGEDNPFYGKSHSEDVKKQISELHSGRELSDEHKEKLSKSLKNRNFSKEHREKLSESQKGKKNSMYGKKGEDCPTSKLTEKDVRKIIKIKCKQNKKYSELAEQFNVSSSTIENIIKRKTWTHI